MKTIKSSKDITTLEVGDVVVLDNLEHVVETNFKHNSIHYYLYYPAGYNSLIFETLNIKKRDFVEKLGIDADCNCDFPETKSLEALTALVSALFKEYEKQNELPKTWEEFCDKYPISNNETVISDNSDILTFDELPNTFTERDPDVDRNFCTSLKEAEAFLALMQLRQLRKAYVKDWEPDWNRRQLVYSVKYDYVLNKLIIEISSIWGNCMSFPTNKLAEQFLINFKDLLEIAKPLL